MKASPVVKLSALMDAFKALNETVLILIQFYYFTRWRSIRRKHETIIINFALIG